VQKTRPWNALFKVFDVLPLSYVYEPLGLVSVYPSNPPIQGLIDFGDAYTAWPS